MTRRSLVVTLLSMSISVPAAEALEPTQADVEYGVAGEHRLLLDLYLPPAAIEPSPLIIWVHGGAWRAGSKASPPITPLVEQGFAIASIDYRLSPVAQFPAQIHDLKRAIRWLRGRATDYRLHPQRFIVAGASAGGHLAALVGVTNNVEALEGTRRQPSDPTSDVQGIVSFYGASNLQTILSQSTAHGLKVRVPALQLFLGGQPQDRPELTALASPVQHVDAHDPPLLLIHGDADPQMPIAQSYELRDAYQRVSRHVELIVVPGGIHGGPGFFEAPQLKRVAEFLSQHVPK